ncbi:hypothetical protein [Bradyrhizobium sp. SZCCHNR1070]|uniref:hypothetical protein n=1 Tax=Bradyrhizobium sp. SZCCHNR1070 TaxID=3057361 RepID=UPI002916A062|nr:hypothetical protein [Bradyrhizobium sp. SZCCHNR1070]
MSDDILDVERAKLLKLRAALQTLLGQFRDQLASNIVDRRLRDNLQRKIMGCEQAIAVVDPVEVANFDQFRIGLTALRMAKTYWEIAGDGDDCMPVPPADRPH